MNPFIREAGIELPDALYRLADAHVDMHRFDHLDLIIREIEIVITVKEITDVPRQFLEPAAGSLLSVSRKSEKRSLADPAVLITRDTAGVKAHIDVILQIDVGVRGIVNPLHEGPDMSHLHIAVVTEILILRVNAVHAFLLQL